MPCNGIGFCVVPCVRCDKEMVRRSRVHRRNERRRLERIMQEVPSA